MSPLRPAPVSINLSDLAVRLGPAVSLSPGADADVAVTGVTLDSRAVNPGDLYAALPGIRTHGGGYAAQAVARGARAILTDPVGAELVLKAGTEVPLLVTSDPRAILGQLAAVLYRTRERALPLIGITGTNGKTTTAYLIQSALSALGEQVGLIGTVETRIGADHVPSVRTTPEAPELHALLAVMAERGLDACVMEVSSHALAQHRVDGVRYDLALFTNLSQDHLDYHASMAAYYGAKAALFTPAHAARGLVCVDDRWGGELARAATVPIETLGTHGQAADWVVTRDPRDSAAFTLSGHGLDLPLRSALPGDFNISNTAMAAAALILTGRAPAEVAAAILRDPQVPGRMEVIPDPIGDPPLRVVIDYAHTPEAIRAALAALRPTTAGALVCVTGAGGDRDRDKRAAMGAAAADQADVVVVTDDNPRSEDPAQIRAAVRSGAMAQVARTARDVVIVELADRREAIAEAVRAGRARGGGTVAILGKGHERGQEIGALTHPFDDRDEARAALNERPGAPS